MEVDEFGVSAVHSQLESEQDLDPGKVVSTVGDFLDRRIKSMWSNNEPVGGALDGIIGDQKDFESRFPHQMQYHPDPDSPVRVRVDEINGVFQVVYPDKTKRYWVPYIQDETICVFTDHFTTPREGSEPIRFLYSGDSEDIPEVPSNGTLDKDLSLVYGALDSYVAEEWGVYIFTDQISGSETVVDYSAIRGKMLESRRKCHEPVQETLRELVKISNNPERQERIIDGTRVYKPKQKWRLRGELIEGGDKFIATSFKTREKSYSELYEK